MVENIFHNFTLKLAILHNKKCKNTTFVIQKNVFKNGFISLLLEKQNSIIRKNLFTNIQIFNITATNGIIKNNYFFNFKNSINFLQYNLSSKICIEENLFQNFSSLKNILNILNKISLFKIRKNLFINNRNISSFVYIKSNKEEMTSKFIFFENSIKNNTEIKNILEIYTFSYLEIQITRNIFLSNFGKQLIYAFFCSNREISIKNNTFSKNSLDSCSINVEGCYLPLIQFNTFSNNLEFSKQKYEIIAQVEFVYEENLEKLSSFNFFNNKNPHDLIFVDINNNNFNQQSKISPFFMDEKKSNLNYFKESYSNLNAIKLNGNLKGDYEMKNEIIVESNTIINGNVLIKDPNSSIQFLKNSRLSIYGDLKIFGSKDKFVKIFCSEKFSLISITIYFGSVLLKNVEVNNVYFHFQQNSDIKIESFYSGEQPKLSMEFNGLYGNPISINNLNIHSTILSINSFNIFITNSTFSQIYSYSIDSNEDSDKLYFEKDEFFQEKTFNHENILLNKFKKPIFFFFAIQKYIKSEIIIPSGFVVFLSMRLLKESGYYFDVSRTLVTGKFYIPLSNRLTFKVRSNSVQQRRKNIVWGFLRKTPGKNEKFLKIIFFLILIIIFFRN